MYLYYFDNTSLSEDVLSEKGNVVVYKKVACIGLTEEKARQGYPTQEKGTDSKGKTIAVELFPYLDDRFHVFGVFKLSKDWEGQ